MIKRFRIIKILNIVVIGLFLNPVVLALSPENEKQLYLGCYTNSKQYLGAKKAKEYCLCTIQMLSGKYTDKEIDNIFMQEPEEIVKKTEFASLHCQKTT